MKSAQRSVIRYLLVFVLVGALGFAGYWGWTVWVNSNNPTIELKVEQVTRGNLVATINAAGTLQPEEVIDVGAQASVPTRIKSFGRDPRDTVAPIRAASNFGSLTGAVGYNLLLAPAALADATDDDGVRLVDYNTPVEKGTVLALLDDAVFRAEYEQMRGSWMQSRTAVDRVQASLEKAKADLDLLGVRVRQTTLAFERASQLRSKGTLPQEEYELADATYRQAQSEYKGGEATLRVAEQDLENAKRAVVVAEKVMEKAEKNLGYTVISSPVKGVVIDRRVNIGQTVVASLNAPSLFLIAKDLTRMQIWVQVNEADIGHIKNGQLVTFNVDTFPRETFKGRVSDRRLNATMTQNVVTYTVVVDTDNRDPSTGGMGKLLPYLTANLQFHVDQRTDVILVPNAALRYRPPLARVHPEHREEFEKWLKKKGPGTEDSGKPASASEKIHLNRGLVWVPEDGFVRPVHVTTGLTDGVKTEITNGELTTEMTVVTGEQQNKQAKDVTVNPFAPPPVFKNKKS